MRNALLGGSLALAASCAGDSPNRLPAAAERALRNPDAMELFALDPVLPNTPGSTPGAEFHDYTILGRAAVSDAAQRAEVAELVLRGIRESDGRVAACFDPRHGVRVEQGGHVLELVICYECLSLAAYGDLLGAGVARRSALTSASVGPELTKVFERAGLRIAK